LVWTIEYTHTAKQQLKKLNKQVAGQIMDYMDQRVAARENPRTCGKVLTGTLGSYWRYRVGDYRVICEIQDTTLSVLVVR
jgi:mRNA interferase RelE/StbE